MSLLPLVHPDSPFGRYPTASYLRWQALVQLLVAAVLIQAPWAKDGFAWGWFVPTVLVLPVFVWLYVQAYVGSARSVPYCIAGIMLLGLLLVSSNASAVYLLLIGCMLLGLLPAWRHGLYGVVAFLLLTALIDRFAHLPPRTAAGVAISGVLGWASCYLYLRNLRRDSALRLTQEQVRHLAMLAERERIGRDLHDLLGHTLSLVTLKSELARRLALTDPPRAQREMAEVERVARHALGEVRTAVTGMRRGDLAAEMISARLMLDACGVLFTGDLPDALCLPPPIEASLALVLREAITNIHRHAHAARARVTCSIDAKRIYMKISDDGRGGLAAHGNGVSGMRERIRALGGALAIDSPARGGTALSITIPLPHGVPDAPPEPVALARARPNAA